MSVWSKRSNWRAARYSMVCTRFPYFNPMSQKITTKQRQPRSERSRIITFCCSSKCRQNEIDLSEKNSIHLNSIQMSGGA